MSTVSNKSLVLPKWDGGDKNFHMWWMRFQACAKIYKFKQAIGTKAEDDLPDKDSDVLDPTKDKDKPKNQARARNELAVASLTMAFTNPSLIGLIHEAQTVDYPDGLAFLVIKQLLDKYKPTDTMSRVELRLKLNKIKMKKSQDPKKLFEQIAEVRNLYSTSKHKINEEDLRWRCPNSLVSVCLDIFGPILL